MEPVTCQLGVPAASRRRAAELYDGAFGEKLGAGISNQSVRIDVLAAGMDLTKAIVALNGDHLVGIAGFHDEDSSLTGGITFGLVRDRLGWVRAIKVAMVLSLLDRTPEPGELLMDGIVVSADARGHGVGTELFRTLEAYCHDRGLERIRLDVVDTNPRARRLYERLGFHATKTERTPYLRTVMGFGASTTMVKTLTRA